MTEALGVVGRWLGDLWTATTQSMHLADWLDLSIALGTALLAVATFQLAKYARRSAEEASDVLAVVTKQADATARRAEVADRALAEHRTQFLRQGRAYVVWDEDDAGLRLLHAADDPRTWHHEKSSGLAIVMRGRLKNVGPTSAFIDEVKCGDRCMLAIVSVPYLGPGQSTDVTLYLAAVEGQRIEFVAYPIEATFASVVTGEPGLARGILGGGATVHQPDTYGVRKVEGYLFVTSLPEKPQPVT